MTFRTLDDADLTGKRALVRVDFNVPMHEGEVSDDTRLRAAIPTIARLRADGAKVILLAHFDRPKGKVVPEMSLAPIAPALAKVLGLPSPSPPTASARSPPTPSPRSRMATSSCWKMSVSMPARKRTIRSSPRPWPPMAISM